MPFSFKQARKGGNHFLIELQTNKETPLQEFMNALFDAHSLIEFREIDSSSKPRFFKLEEVASYDPPMDKNIYFGVYARNKCAGKAENCTTTGALWLDFDFKPKEGEPDKTIDEKISIVKQNIRLANLPNPSITINSGHGVHAYWLLTERAGNEALPLLKVMAQATEADSRATDKARIMRVPGTMNVKSVPVFCSIIEADYNEKYDLKLFVELFKDKLKDGIEQVTPPKQKLKAPPRELLESKRACTQKAASGVPEGARNFWLGRITKELQQRGYKKTDAFNIVVQWNENNEPPEQYKKLSKDFNAYWKGGYKLLGCTIENPELQSLLSDLCERENCSLRSTFHVNLDQAVAYNNRPFSKIYDLLGNALIVWGVLLRHEEGLNTSQLIDKLTARNKRRKTKEVCMTRKTLIDCLQALQELKLIDCIPGNTRAGKENFYYVIKQGTYGTGFTLCSNGALNGAIDGRVTPAEFRLYVLLLKFAYGKGSAYPTIDTLAKEMRVTRECISAQLRSLEKADYIKRNYGYEDNQEKLIMTLKV